MSGTSAPEAVLVTGASTGIGRACALHLDSLGYTVFAGVRRREDGQALAAEGSARLEPLILDVTVPRQVERAAAEVAEAVGERGLHGLVNHSGALVGGPLEFVPLEDLRQQLEVSLVGQVAVTQALLPLLRRARGRILFVSSVGGRAATAFGGPSHASGWALEALADAWRGELEPFGIAVSTIEPATSAKESRRRGEEAGGNSRPELPDDAERLYGEAMDALEAAARNGGRAALVPERVAEAVEEALTAARPRARYHVGIEAKGTVAARAVLRPRLFSRLTRRVARLP